MVARGIASVLSVHGEAALAEGLYARMTRASAARKEWQYLNWEIHAGNGRGKTAISNRYIADSRRATLSPVGCEN
jgi:hypothetical protein